MPGTEWVKMSELARRAGVPAPTIKHWIREGLLPEPRRTSRTMAWYDASIVPRIGQIRQLQRERFLPLEVIRDVLDEADRGRSLSGAVAHVLRERKGEAFRSRASLVEAGVPEEALAFFEAAGLLEPRTRDGAPGYDGDDLELLRILGEARREGLGPEMLPFTMLQPYLAAVRTLAELELALFEEGVVPHTAAEALPARVEVADRLSERLLVLLRRKTLRALAREREPE